MFKMTVVVYLGSLKNDQQDNDSIKFAEKRILFTLYTLTMPQTRHLYSNWGKSAILNKKINKNYVNNNYWLTRSNTSIGLQIFQWNFNYSNYFFFCGSVVFCKQTPFTAFSFFLLKPFHHI